MDDNENAFILTLYLLHAAQLKQQLVKSGLAELLWTFDINLFMNGVLDIIKLLTGLQFWSL